MSFWWLIDGIQVTVSGRSRGRGSCQKGGLRLGFCFRLLPVSNQVYGCFLNQRGLVSELVRQLTSCIISLSAFVRDGPLLFLFRSFYVSTGLSSTVYHPRLSWVVRGPDAETAGRD
ncbi:hypothetical protein L6452_15841 [Arctium lappa]|uniref:Uncharacterized protein n=1 Tax=Arctium lappa TaxID=4217 RepID=A0ACB9CQF3_ARCLA|nr:hypothetical protein L6452_15841 [Arctium lappa]